MQQKQPRDRGLWAGNPYIKNKAKVRIRPSQTYTVTEEELAHVAHECLCTIVWHNDKRVGATKGWRELKYIHRFCPFHEGVECSYDICM